jgi:hypothetical protein
VTLTESQVRGWSDRILQRELDYALAQRNQGDVQTIEAEIKRRESDGETPTQ